MLEVIRKYIRVKGIVQGVGFRPFIYRLASENNLLGDVKNSSMGVCINVQGTKEKVDKFILELREKAPRLSRIDEIIVEEMLLMEYEKFSIIISEEKSEGITLISPDIASCHHCMEEVLNNNYKGRFLYPFTNCTNCGPRFTIIKNIPYDRKNTTMEEFQMCAKCNEEYNDPLDRRFHAEPTCCEQCGPSIQLLDGQGHVLNTENPLAEVRKILKAGYIVGVKGIGGFNLVCDGKSQEAITILRRRKFRKTKPLALMMKNIDEVRKYCQVGELEKNILQGNGKPIVLLKKINDELPDNIAFENNNLGVLLPYSPLHYLLFDEELSVLVFTSGNPSGGTMEYENEEGINTLKGLADYFLIHNRKINLPIDDSVVRVALGEEQVIRGGRGYAPLYINIKSNKRILACGGELKNTFALSVKDNVYISPYIGDLETVEVQENFKRNLNHVKSLYNLNFDIIAHDMHPNYWHEEYLRDFKIRKVGIYHHHAHIVSCLVDNGEKDKVIGIAFDGIGYGRDENLWGGEFLICDYKGFKRVGQIDYMAMPGGDSATKNPWIMGVSLAYKALVGNVENIMEVLPKSFPEKQVNLVLSVLCSNPRTNLCSSMGRLFDGVASFLGFTDKITFEGEAAIYLENLARIYKEKPSCEKETYEYQLKCKDGVYVFNTNSIIGDILSDIKDQVDYGRIALKFHRTIIEMCCQMCVKLRAKCEINKVALSGGVFQNNILLCELYDRLKSEGFQVLIHKRIPCNDSGISVGQFFIANEIAKE